MAYLYRLSLALVLASVCFAAGAFPATAGFTYSINSIFGEPGTSGSSAAAACQAKPAAYAQSCGAGCETTLFFHAATETVCTIRSYYAPFQSTDYTNASVFKIPSNTCPGNSTLAGGQCTCNATYTEQAGQCVSIAAKNDADCKAVADGATYAGGALVHFGAVGLTACYGGFTLTGSGGASGGGQSELYGPFNCSANQGQTCLPTPKPSTVTTQCDPGSFPGTVNGVQICSPKAVTNSVSAPTVTASTPSGTGTTSTTPGTGDPAAPPGTASTSKTVTCTQSTCTTTVSYRAPDGSPLGKKTEETPKTSYCADNPKAPGCMEEKKPDPNTFAGNCTGTFSAGGDAVLGAIAKAVNETKCAFFDKTSPESDLYTASKSAGTGTNTSVLTSSQVALTSGSFDQSNSLGVGASCISDKTITVMGQTATLPISLVCPYLAILGNVLLALSFVSALLIVGRPT